MSTTESALVPIREVSRLTGVNSITLRAWERRYGLIKPQRTPKGHRLYSENEVARVHQILAWLERGYSIGQVKPLLDGNAPPSQPEQHPVEWELQATHLLTAVKTLNSNKFDAILQQLTALYPLETCVNQLLYPLMQQLQPNPQQQVLGAELEWQFLLQSLHSFFLQRLYQSAKQAQGPLLLIIELDQARPSWLATLQAWQASQQGFRTHLVGQLPFAELPIALERLQAKALIGVAEQPSTQHLNHFTRLRQLYPQLPLGMLMIQPHPSLELSSASIQTCYLPHLSLIRNLLVPSSRTKED